jgi:hypothetical protein
MYSSGEGDLSPILEGLAQRLRVIEAECNPKNENLHFGAVVRTSPEMLEALYEIGLEAWHAVENDQSWKASFWFYNWFLLVASVCLQIWRDRTQEEYPDELANRMALLLLEISQMTTKNEYEGDIRKRLYEAMVHVLLAFGKLPHLYETVTTRAQEMQNERVIGFAQGAIESARDIQRKDDIGAR